MIGIGERIEAVEPEVREAVSRDALVMLFWKGERDEALLECRAPQLGLDAPKQGALAGAAHADEHVMLRRCIIARAADISNQVCEKLWSRDVQRLNLAVGQVVGVALASEVANIRGRGRDVHLAFGFGSERLMAMLMQCLRQ